MKAMWMAALLLVTMLAGCAQEQDERLQQIMTPAGHVAYDFTEYDWATPVVVGNATDHPWLAGELFPRTVQSMVPGGGAEPNIGITSAGNIYVTTFDQVRKSSDGGLSWEVVHDFVSPGAPVVHDRFSTSDPMLWVDTDTDRVFVLHMHPGTDCFHLAFSDDEGASWSDEVTSTEGQKGMGCLTPYVDHPKIVTGPVPAGSPLVTLGYDNLVYVCVNRVVSVFGITQVLGSWCQVSLDGGRTFDYDNRAIAPTPGCAAINGHPATYDDGTIVLPAGNLGGARSGCTRGPLVSVSQDGGLTWSERSAPTDLIVHSIDPDITITPDGTAYYVFRAHDNTTYLYRSPDKFVTWEGPWAITPEDQSLNVFQAITSGDDGHISIAWLGTRDEMPDPEFPGSPPLGPSDAPLGTRWHLFVAHSSDADSDEPSFLVQQVNPLEDPVQVGCIWLRGGNGGPYLCRNHLDFIDMTISPEGRVYVAITDGCVPRNGCAADPDAAHGMQSRDRQISVAVQDSGASLFASVGILESLGLTHPPMPEEEAHVIKGDDA